MKQLVGEDLHTLKASKTFWYNFSALVNRFTEREFSFEGDVLDGFSGITNALATFSGEKFIWGMPTSRMGLALLWEDYDSTFPNEFSMKRRLERTTLPVSSFQSRLRIPSWSWLGWSGIIELQLGDDERYVLHNPPDKMLTIPMQKSSYTGGRSVCPRTWRYCSKFDLITTRKQNFHTDRIARTLSSLSVPSGKCILGGK